MTLESLLTEMGSDISQDQKAFAMSQYGANRPVVSMEKVQLDVIKNVLNHVYRPNEYSVGANGSVFDVAVGNETFSGPFDRVLKSCVEFVVKPQPRK